MTKEEKFIEALKGNIPKEEFPTVIQAKVKSAGATSCVVTLTENDLELPDVQYSATDENKLGVVLVPKEGTNVLVGLIGQDINSLYLVAMDEVETVKIEIESTKMVIDKNGIVINDGNNDGMVISQKATDEINALRLELSNLKSIFTSWAPVPNDGGAFLKASVATWASSTLAPINKTVLENGKVTH